MELDPRPERPPAVPADGDRQAAADRLADERNLEMTRRSSGLPDDVTV
jgi:hypothetical protein